MPVRVQVVCEGRPHPDDQVREPQISGTVSERRNLLLSIAEDERDLFQVSG